MCVSLCCRVHNNSQANAMMQQATVILQVEESMPLLRRFYNNQYISSHCLPLVEPSDDGITIKLHYHDEMGWITVQIKVRFWRTNSDLKSCASGSYGICASAGGSRPVLGPAAGGGDHRRSTVRLAELHHYWHTVLLHSAALMWISLIQSPDGPGPAEPAGDPEE